VAARFDVSKMNGTHGIGLPHGDRVRRHHDGRAPVLDRPDQCLVHNGSLSNTTACAAS
jgi:amidophosphoribosyltransferase